MDRYIILCDHNITWRNKMAAVLKEYNIETVFAEVLEDTIEMLRKKKYSLVVCSEYEFDEYCKTSGVTTELSIKEILQSDANLLIISDCTNDDKEIELFNRGVLDYQWRERDIRIIARRIISAAFLKKDGSYILQDEVRVILSGDDSTGFTPKEYAVLSVIASYNGRVISKEEIIQEVWNGNYREESRSLDTIIKQLRKKIKKYGLQIKNKYGEGYFIE